MQRTNRIAVLLLASTLLSACSSTLDRLDNVGKPPKFTPVANPAEAPEYKPLTWPMPETQPAPKQYANSLWQPGARAFYRDQRAARVGDILRVTVKFEDKAELNNDTQGKRDSTDALGAPNVFGLEQTLAGNIKGVGIPLKDPSDTSKLLSITGSQNTKGSGIIKRKEKIETQLAASIIQVLPNGNFVIEGSQQMTVNYELREISIKGLIRPQDIRSDNTIDSSQIAEARITYGGVGQLMDVQHPSWGTEAVRAISPF